MFLIHLPFWALAIIAFGVAFFLFGTSRSATANMNASSSLQQRKIFCRLSIFVGNLLQIAGIVAACAALALARSAHPKPAGFAAAMLIAAWLLLYFFCHGIAHWAVGRLVGIRFAFYTIGATGNP